MNQPIYFNPKEVMALAMGLARIIEDFNTSDPLTPFTPETRRDIKDILENVRTAAAKIEKFTGFKCVLPDLEPGEEKDYLTKES